MCRVAAPDGRVEWVWLEDANLTALDQGRLVLYPVTLQWQRESEVQPLRTTKETKKKGVK